MNKTKSIKNNDKENDKNIIIALYTVSAEYKKKSTTFEKELNTFLEERYKVKDIKDNRKSYGDKELYDLTEVVQEVVQDSLYGDDEPLSYKELLKRISRQLERV